MIDVFEENNDRRIGQAPAVDDGDHDDHGDNYDDDYDDDYDDYDDDDDDHT